ncbi:MAG: OB-fold domain-containing protein [Novosphingobium sp.]|nr:OB-fold domain-containing protein [Novosphingobium sp.]
MTMETALPPRNLPAITEMNNYFWKGGADGRLHILRCQGEDCRYWIHPYAGRCPSCGGADLAPEPVSGRATVAGFTVNHQPWIPGVPVPYVIAIVELEERADLRLMTNLPTIPIEDVHIGLPVKVCFEPAPGGVFVPLFEKA